MKYLMASVFALIVMGAVSLAKPVAPAAPAAPQGCGEHCGCGCNEGAPCSCAEVGR